MLDALKKAYPSARRHSVLEDNDPTGFKSKLGIAAKRASGIYPFEIPKRSPDLSVMDYAIWRAINRKMRAQERRMAKGKRETRQQYIRRLKRAALSLDPAFIKKSIMNMKRRCQLLYAAKGSYFEEGS
eukprot:11742573-Karenia_brevis.AAC.1